MKIKIFMGLGIVSIFGAIFSAINTAKDEEAEEIEARKANETETNHEEEPKTVKEKIVKFLVKAARKAKTYIVTIAFTAFAIFCFTFALHVSAKQTAAAVTAAKMAQEAFLRYKDAAKEVVGEKQERFIANKAAEKKAEDDKIDEKSVYEAYRNTDERDVSLFYDPYSETLFPYSRAEMDIVENELNSLIKDQGFISIQDFYDVAKLELFYKKSLDLGINEVDGPVRLGLEPIILKKGPHAGEVAFVITMPVMPYYDYME